MWQRKTFHDCALELQQVSDLFRAAHSARKQERMRELSIDGVEILRVLALAVRSEEDYGLIERATKQQVGILLRVTPPTAAFLRAYQPPYTSTSEGEPLFVREALNKIAHADPSNADYRATDELHELLLSGTRRNETWIAVISIPALCQAIKLLPDRNIELEDRHVANLDDNL